MAWGKKLLLSLSVFAIRFGYFHYSFIYLFIYILENWFLRRYILKKAFELFIIAQEKEIGYSSFDTLNLLLGHVVTVSGVSCHNGNVELAEIAFDN